MFKNLKKNKKKLVFFLFSTCFVFSLVLNSGVVTGASYDDNAITDMKEKFHTLELLQEGSTDNFTYEWKKVKVDDGDMGLGNTNFQSIGQLKRDLEITMLNVSYGGKSAFYNQRSSFYWSVVSEPYNEYTGAMDIAFCNWDSNYDIIMTSILKYSYKMNFSTTEEPWSGNEGDIEWFKDNAQLPYENYARGISNLTLSAPEMINDTYLSWSVKYKSIWICQHDLPDPLDYSINSSFYVNHTFFLSVSNDQCALKIDTFFDEFDIGTQDQGDLYETARIRNAWEIAISAVVPKGDEEWKCGDVILNKTHYNEIDEAATLTAENVPIAQLDFGYEYVINETETRDLITKAQKVNTSNPYSWLQTGITYEQWFTDLNMSRVVSIGMDPAVITNFNTNDYVPGNDNNLFMMLIPLISILAIAGIIIVVVVFIKKRK